MKIYSFYIKDDQNADYLGKDLSQIIDVNFEKSRPFISHIDIEEDGKKIKIFIQLKTNKIHNLKIVLNVTSYDNVLLDMKIGTKSIRVDSQLKRFSSEILDKYFSNLDKALYSISKKLSIKEGLPLEDDEVFISLLDAINKILIY